MMLEMINVSACRFMEVSFPCHSCRLLLALNVPNFLLVKKSEKETCCWRKPKVCSFFLYKLSSSFMCRYVVLSMSLLSSVSMVSLFACSIHRRRNACLFGFFCLFIFYFLIEITSYLLSDAARARVFVSLTSFITLQTAFKERRRCLWGETLGWKRKG